MQYKWILTGGLLLLAVTFILVLHEQHVYKGGLQITDVVKGTGALAEPGRKLQVHYTGWFSDGTKFDSSHARGTPLEFTLGQGEVIQGWEKGLEGMRAGGTRRLTIPPALGHGDGADLIPPNATLIYEIELLSVDGQRNEQLAPE